MSDRKRYLFVCGCPRSGTTALWRILAAHPQIVLGVERFIMLASKKFRIKPALFEKSAFFDLKPGQTFYRDLAGFNRYYVEAERRFDDAVWVGDKMPTLYIDYPGIEANFDNAHILFIVRNIFDVAESYQKRAINPADGTWREDRDYRRAIYDWRQSIRATLALLDKPQRRTALQVVVYEDLLLDKADLRPMFEWLDLDVAEPVRAQYDQLMKRSPELDKQRGSTLTSTQYQDISATAPFELYRKLLDRRLRLPAAAAAGGAPPRQRPRAPAPQVAARAM